MAVDTEPSDSKPGQAASEQMVALITAAQRPLFAYIRALVSSWGSVDDVLQEVNLVLWRKASEFDGRGEFLSWACRIAYLQVLAHRKKIMRERFVPLDETILADLSEPLVQRVRDIDRRTEALRECLKTLPTASQRLVASRYAEGGSVQGAAREVERTAESVRVTLHRIRKALLECTQKRLAGATS
ncbi:MAG: sigma-70 family RNA polymerase sigma factor [Planctomycetota bacterium]